MERLLEGSEYDADLGLEMAKIAQRVVAREQSELEFYERYHEDILEEFGQNVLVLDVVENMSGYHCPNCEDAHRMFGESGVADIGDEYDVPVIAELLVHPDFGSETGGPTVRDDSGTCLDMTVLYHDERTETEARIGAQNSTGRYQCTRRPRSSQVSVRRDRAEQTNESHYLIRRPNMFYAFSGTENLL